MPAVLEFLKALKYLNEIILTSKACNNRQLYFLYMVNNLPSWVSDTFFYWHFKSPLFPPPLPRCTLVTETCTTGWIWHYTKEVNHMNGQKRQPQQELGKTPLHFILHSCFSNTELHTNLYSLSLLPLLLLPQNGRWVPEKTDWKFNFMEESVNTFLSLTEMIFGACQE